MNYVIIEHNNLVFDAINQIKSEGFEPLVVYKEGLSLPNTILNKVSYEIHPSDGVAKWLKLNKGRCACHADRRLFQSEEFSCIFAANVLELNPIYNLRHRNEIRKVLGDRLSKPLDSQFFGGGEYSWKLLAGFSSYLIGSEIVADFPLIFNLFSSIFIDQVHIMED